MWEIGARDRVVGVSGYAGYLEGAGSRTNVSGAGQSLVSVEAVVGLDPDLVLAPNVVTNETVERLRGAGLTVYRFPPATAVGGSDPGWGLTVVEKTRLTGELVGACDGAARSVRTMEAQLDQVRRATESRERPRVLYVFFGFTAGEGTFVDEVITLAGGENVAASVGLAGYQRISPETVVAEDPEWIVLNSDAPAVPRSDAYNSTTAVREGNTVVLDADEISQPAPRIVVPIRTLAEALHPGAVAALTADPSGSPSASTPPPTPTPEPDPTPTASTTTFAVDDTPSDGSADGFGFGVALAALAVLGLLAILAALRNRDRGGGDGPA
jgi:iron complex transport system substrate-binding protein